jgi:uncharacterized membrane-anchored protein YhcB (DUF1043 family)
MLHDHSRLSAFWAASIMGLAIAVDLEIQVKRIDAQRQKDLEKLQAELDTIKTSLVNIESLP